MLEYCLWDLVNCMRREEEKIAGNTRDRGEKQGRARIRKVGEGLSVPRHEFPGLIRRLLDEYETISGRVWLDSPGRLFARRGAVSDAGGDTGAA